MEKNLDIDNCKESISKLFEKEEERYIDYENFMKTQTADNLYIFLIKWNKAIGILNNYEVELKKALNKFLKKRKIYKIFLQIPYMRNFISNKIYDEIYNSLYIAINKERKLRIPTIKIAHILYPDFFPIFDNKILENLMEKKNFLSNKDQDFLKKVVFLYKNCINLSNKYNLSYKVIDEYFYLKYVKNIDLKNKIKDKTCLELFEKFEIKLRECLKEKLKQIKGKS